MADSKDAIRVASHWFSNIALDLLQTRRRQFKFTKAWLKTNYHWVDSQRLLPTTTLRDLYPDSGELVVPMQVRYNFWNISPTELYMLSCLAICSKPEVLFEFGTYDGATTLQLARCCPGSQIYTIDLSENPDYIDEHFRTGSRFRGTEQEMQITQFYGNSKTYDLSDLFGKVDFIFIDGWHDYDVVKQDTQNALRMIRPGGLIVWDDFGNWSGVRQAVAEITDNYPVKQLEETKFAVLKC